MRLDSAWFTHPGGHPQNEDALRLDVGADRAWAVVCDGLGGMGGGAQAAAICADAIAAALRDGASMGLPQSPAAGREPPPGGVGAAGRGGSQVPTSGPAAPGAPPLGSQTVSVPDAVAAAVLDGHAALVAAREDQPALRQAQSTAAVAVVEGGDLTWANVGDSRIYRFNGHRLAGASLDDSAGYAAFRRGEVDHEGIRLYDGRSRLTAALGDDPSPEPHTGQAALAEGDAVLVCSDGFWQYVWDLEMEIDLAKADTAADWLELMLLRLVQRSRLDGDNLTAAAWMVRSG